MLFMVAFLFLAGPAYGDLADDFLRKGNARMQAKDYRQAITLFESAHRIDPDNKSVQKNLSIAYHNMAVLYAQKAQYENAIRNSLRALRFDPASNVIKEQLAVFYNNLALTLAEKKNYKQSYENIKKALTYSPLSNNIKKNLYNILLQYADYFQKNKNDYSALKLAREAIGVLPDEVSGYIFTGNLYYNQDRFSDALKYWNKAIQLDPGNDNLRDRIESLKREKSVESGFGTRKRNFFRIRYDKDIDARYVNQILNILDQAQRSLRSQFNLYSDEVIPVIIYDDIQFAEATEQPHWTLGLYDGKIRLRFQDISRDDKALRRVLFHEYSHAMLYLNIGTNIPIWLNEGFAQFNEPDNEISKRDKAFLAEYMQTNHAFNLERLNDIFNEKEDQKKIRAAYLQSKLFFDYLYRKYGKHRMKRLFYELETDKPWQKALTEVYVNSIDRLELNFSNYLDDLLR
jgi:tetratricopeptide (TPR) repeat protein